MTAPASPTPRAASSVTGTPGPPGCLRQLLPGQQRGGSMPLARSRISPAVFAVLIPAAAACAAGDSSTREWTGIRDTIDGVEIVRNPSAPLLADGTDRKSVG